MPTLITGTAGFIGFHTAKTLLDRGKSIIGVDCVTDYYDQRLKEDRLATLRAYPGFSEERFSISDGPRLSSLFQRVTPKQVIHLAAQAGVRYSVENPFAYGESNLTGFLNVLECCRQSNVQHLVYASTSSVYGANGVVPFCETDGTSHPLSLYAATKRANEIMAHSYSHLFNLPTTGLRFFTVYGPWGRPDMALFKFTKAMLAGQPIDVYNNGDMQRDFTYIDDIVEGIIRVVDRPPSYDPEWSAKARTPIPNRSGVAPFRVYNIGRGQPVSLLEFIATLEKCLKIKAHLNAMPMQPGDVATTCADTTDLQNDIGYTPSISVTTGVARFVQWYRDYYKT